MFILKFSKVWYVKIIIIRTLLQKRKITFNGDIILNFKFYINKLSLNDAQKRSSDIQNASNI